MDARIIVVGGPLSGQVFPLAVESEFAIGRDPAGRLPVADPLVSRHHCVISNEHGQFTVHDLESRNGTFVNNVPVRERLLQHGDRIRIGETVLLFLPAEPEVEAAGRQPVSQVERDLTRTLVRLKREDAVYLQPESPRTDRLARDLSALVRISAAISTIAELDALQRRLLELILEVVPAQRGTLLLMEDSQEEPASQFSLQRDPGQELPPPVGHDVARQVLEKGEALLCDNALETSSLSLLAVPVSLFDRALGVIWVDTSDPVVRFDEHDLQLVTAIASTVAGALNSALRIRRLESDNRRLLEEAKLAHNMIGESRGMREVLRFVAKTAPKETTVLIRGESGTGKELVARALHENSPRAAKPFVAVNCAALAETLLESELFGHERGSFTGAIAQKRGKLELADGGTLLLDEIGDLPPAMQIKLLRVLQEREFERVGGTRSIKVDIRLIAATNRDLEAAMKAGSFRPDLYYRLNVVSVTLPALRQRREDVPLLASYFATTLSQKVKRHVAGISRDARALLMRYDWPGNIRELENAIEHAVVLGSSDVILPEDLPEAVIEGSEPEDASPTLFHGALRETKKRLILDAVEQAGGNLTAAAKSLGLHPNYLHRLIRNMGLRAAMGKGAAGGRQSP